MDASTKINIGIGIVNLIALVWNTIHVCRSRWWDVTDKRKRAVREKQARISFILGKCGNHSFGAKTFDIDVVNNGGSSTRDVVIKIDGVEKVFKREKILPEDCYDDLKLNELKELYKLSTIRNSYKT